MSNITPKSLEALLKRLIDYAGLFPPASLPLDQAFKNFIEYTSGDYNWMLSSFITPAKKLDELTQLIQGANTAGPLRFSILGTGGDTVDDFNDSFKNDIEAWKKFLTDNEGKVKTKFYEVKLPQELIASQDSGDIGDFVETVSSNVADSIGKDTILFFEATPGSEWRTDISAAIEGIKIHDIDIYNTGFKLRTGGTNAADFPLPEVVAFTIRECLNRQIALKFTAGLHHPFRHRDEEFRKRIHGFINIFAAGAIAIRHNISEYELINILEEEDPATFEFTDEYFSWDKYRVTAEDIKYSREALTISFGSCSFTEPIEDLQKLNLL